MNKILPLIAMLYLGSCYEVTREKVEALAATQLAERQSNQLRDRMAICSRLIYSEAQTRADSALRIESKQAKLDSILVPHDTLRPLRPEVDFPDYAQPSRDSIKIPAKPKK
ncbi:MAG: hypothetical protein K1X68_05835 [Saprospiraceae bacterium]|nr:hypothetical protein [Saprospiraceae bacterium]HMW40056.1 hypothetical protein [Saprospiraceae bacterium]HMX88699.1 hypothetical protein [Saprospiraceae bacterium]HMZ40131.1 hypothetical protein [Saprospiraceae bacterium]HNA64923.1 hypothetical protein [Saprospiraceae bacterium]